MLVRVKTSETGDGGWWGGDVGWWQGSGRRGKRNYSVW